MGNSRQKKIKRDNVSDNRARTKLLTIPRPRELVLRVHRIVIRRVFALDSTVGDRMRDVINDCIVHQIGA